MCPVGIQKSACDIHDLSAAPLKHQPRLLRHHRNFHSLQILLRSIAQEGLHILRRNHHRHTLLRFGDGQFRAVQTRIFLRHLIQIHHQTVRQLPDSHRHTAGAEIVTLLDQPAHFLPAEQSLDLTLRGRISLLHFGAAGLDGAFRMYLGRSRGSAAAVTSRPAA